MCQSASGLLASGSSEIPLRALIYLAWTQKEDGGFDQMLGRAFHRDIASRLARS